MKITHSIRAVLLTVMLIFSGCSLNIFSVFAPSKSENVNDLNSLIELGNASLRKADYNTALTAYEKALKIDPLNSYALEGASTAYCYKVMPVSNFIKLLTTTTKTGLGIYLNDLYSISAYSSDKLWLIVNGNADGKIGRSDLNVNISYFLFNSFQTVFSLSDTDNDRNINEDGGDLIIIRDDLSFSNKFYTITNDFLASFQILSSLKLRKLNFDRLYDRSLVSLENVVQGLKTVEMKESFSNTAVVLFIFKEELDNVLSILGLDNNTFSFSNTMVSFGYTNFTPGNAGPSVLLFLTNSGVTNKDQFTNSLVQSGFTDSNGSPSVTAFTEAMTNLYPDLASSSGSINSSLSNYYGL